MKLTCASPACERAPIRERDGQRFCMYHPDAQPPIVDAKTGKVVAATKLVRAPRPELEKPPAQRAPSRRERPPVSPTAAAAAPVAPPVSATAVVKGGPCQRDEACIREGGHAGKCGHPRPARVVKQRHHVAVDEVEAARRYQDGGRLFDLAAELGIGVARLRRILNDQGVRIRSRGEIIERRGRQVAAPLDEARARELYATGLTTVQVGAMLGVRGERVAAVLRAHDELRPPASAYQRAEEQHDVRLRLDPDLVARARGRAAQLGHDYLTSYIRDLILSDVAQGSPAAVAELAAS